MVTGASVLIFLKSVMKPTCYNKTTTYQYSLISMCGLPSDFGRHSQLRPTKSASPSGFIIPLKSKLYCDEK